MILAPRMLPRILAGESRFLLRLFLFLEYLSLVDPHLDADGDYKTKEKTDQP